jgi:hypothetical protein
MEPIIHLSDTTSKNDTTTNKELSKIDTKPTQKITNWIPLHHSNSPATQVFGTHISTIDPPMHPKDHNAKHAIYFPAYQQQTMKTAGNRKHTHHAIVHIHRNQSQHKLAQSFLLGNLQAAFQKHKPARSHLSCI